MKYCWGSFWVSYANNYHIYFKHGSLNPVDKAVTNNDIKTAWFNNIPGSPSFTQDSNQHSRDTLSVIYFNNIPKELATNPNADNIPTFEYYRLHQFFNIWVSPRSNLFSLELSKYQKNIPVIIDSDNKEA